MSSELPIHQERVRHAVLEDLPEAPAVSSVEIAKLQESLKAGTALALRDKDILTPIRVDRHALPRALRCPASASGDPFEWTATFASRTLGITALRMVVRNKRDVGTAVAASIDDALERGGDLADWLSAQSPPARAATLAAVTTWVSRAAIAVPWHVLGAPIDFDVRTWHRPLGRSSPVVYCGRSEAEIWCHRPGGRERVLLSLGRPDSAVSGLDVMARALETGRAPPEVCDGSSRQRRRRGHESWRAAPRASRRRLPHGAERSCRHRFGRGAGGSPRRTLLVVFEKAVLLDRTDLDRRATGPDRRHPSPGTRPHATKAPLPGSAGVIPSRKDPSVRRSRTT